MNLDYKHDTRLDRVEPSQYRIWHDAQNILVKEGDSTTKPLTKETVNANTRVYGKIRKSYFNRPWVDFTNTNVDIERFDRYKLQVWRDELPTTDPNIDYHDDIGLNKITIYYHAVFSVMAEYLHRTNTIYGESFGYAEINYSSGQTWLTEPMHFDLYDAENLRGYFYIVTNPLAVDSARGTVYPTGTWLQQTNLPIYVVATSCRLQVGNSYMQLMHKNGQFPLRLFSFDFSIVGGE